MNLIILLGAVTVSDLSTEVRSRTRQGALLQENNPRWSDEISRLFSYNSMTAWFSSYASELLSLSLRNFVWIFSQTFCRNLAKTPAVRNTPKHRYAQIRAARAYAGQLDVTDSTPSYRVSPQSSL